MQTQTVGDLLRAAREKAHFTLEELADSTHIKIEYLVALEENDFDALPAATFIKAYIRNYARLFKLDEKPLFAILRRDYEESAKGQLIPREFLYPQLKKKTSWLPIRLVLLSVITIFVVFFSYAAWQFYQLNRPPALSLSVPLENAEVSPNVLVQGQTTADAMLTINATPVALRADGSFETELYLPQEGTNTITIKANDQNGKSTILQRSVQVKF
ncbi:MAG TPA: helix-turn-helix domain-containing protein [Candidatus Woesebacteria bacterium]|mgnify:CR=1 FL=1|jgi:cytoskeletal protein RodZ|nr:helix-turn-helix domain-containing protein [Candidatus Woesebacteria bacterium]